MKNFFIFLGLVSVLFVFSCEQSSNIVVNKNDSVHDIIKAVPTGQITVSSWPTRTSYYLSEGTQTVSLTCSVFNNYGSGATYTVVFSIQDPDGNIYTIDSENHFIAPNDSEIFSLSGNIPAITVSGWFDTIVQVKSGTFVVDSDTNNDNFTVFHELERFSTNVLSTDYSISDYTYQAYGNGVVASCSPNYFGYENTNATWSSSGSGYLDLLIPSTQSPDRMGAQIVHNSSYTYGEFRTKIKMNVDTDYTLGAFWLRPPSGTSSSDYDSIVMEVVKYSATEYAIKPLVYKNGSYTHTRPAAPWYITTTNPNSDFIEYKIVWTPTHIQFFYDTIKISEETTTGDIPDDPLHMAFCYRMTPYCDRTGIDECEPSLPSSTIHFQIDQACW